MGSNNKNISDREDVYRKLFGDMQHVWHETKPGVPHIDIYCFKKGHAGRDFFTLVTGGMSDVEIDIPDSLPPELQRRRVELVFYCDLPETKYAELLQSLAHYPFKNRTWFGPGHTMETDDVALLEDQDVNALLFLPTPVIPDDSLPIRLQFEDEPVTLLWVVPITTEECALARTEGYLETAMMAFEKNGRPYVYSPGRSA